MNIFLFPAMSGSHPDKRIQIRKLKIEKIYDVIETSSVDKFNYLSVFCLLYNTSQFTIQKMLIPGGVFLLS